MPENSSIQLVIAESRITHRPLLAEMPRSAPLPPRPGIFSIPSTKMPTAIETGLKSAPIAIDCHFLVRSVTCPNRIYSRTYSPSRSWYMRARVGEGGSAYATRGRGLIVRTGLGRRSVAVIPIDCCRGRFIQRETLCPILCPISIYFGIIQ
jgi:hypothetical protein